MGSIGRDVGDWGELVEVDGWGGGFDGGDVLGSSAGYIIGIGGSTCVLSFQDKDSD